MNGIPRERASGLGKGDIAQASHETGEYASWYGAGPSASLEQDLSVHAQPSAGADRDEEAAPRWQEVADAVWLAAHWIREGRPTADDRPEVTTGDDRITVPGPQDRSSASGTLGQRILSDGERPADALLGGDTSTDGGTSHPDLAERTDPMGVGGGPEAAPRPGASRGGTLGGSATPRGVAPPRLLPDPNGAETVYVSGPLLPAPGSRSGRPGPGRQTAMLARSLHGLARRVPSRDATELDEEITAERGVVDGMWIPFFRPARTSAFDLVLLSDDAPSMRIWDDTTARLAEAAEQSGAFRMVRTVKVSVPRTGTPTLRWGAAPGTADPAELLDGEIDASSSSSPTAWRMAGPGRPRTRCSTASLLPAPRLWCTSCHPICAIAPPSTRTGRSLRPVASARPTAVSATGHRSTARIRCVPCPKRGTDRCSCPFCP